MNRKQPVRVETISLKDDYEGWSFDARMNPKMRIFSEIASGNYSLMARGLSKIMLKWNFVNEEGDSLPEIPTEDLILDLPIDLINLVIEIWIEKYNTLSKNLKTPS